MESTSIDRLKQIVRDTNKNLGYDIDISKEMKVERFVRNVFNFFSVVIFQ